MKHLFLILASVFIVSCNSQKKADLLVYNAKVYTVDGDFSIAEAFAVKDGKFIEIGTSDEVVKKYVYGATQVIDAKGKAIYPGFYDSHAHFPGLAEFLGQADLNGANSFEEVIERLKKFENLHPEKKWIVGGGWDQNLWPGKQFPTKELLDQAFPDKAVYINRVDYHAAVANSKALELNKITEVVEVPGGVVGGNNGVPNGLLIDNAMDLVQIPPLSDAEFLKALQVAQDSLFSVGLTTIVDAGLSTSKINLFKEFYKKGLLKIRNYGMVMASLATVDEYLKLGIYSSDRFDLKAFKISSDGALGSRGACLLEKYSDADTKGFLLLNPTDLETIIEKLANSPFQVNTHAIGDSANRIVLNLYGKHLTNNLERRWRIEHAQIISPSDFGKFKEFKIIPSIQPTHATSDMSWAVDRIGTERLKNAYAYKHLLKEYGKVALGSDFPVEHFNPLYGFHAAVARVDAKGNPAGGFQKENALTREEALKGMTIWSAFSCFQEKRRGSIEVGKDADFIILNDDIMTASEEKLRKVKTWRTVVAGEVVYKEK